VIYGTTLFPEEPQLQQRLGAGIRHHARPSQRSGVIYDAY